VESHLAFLRAAEASLGRLTGSDPAAATIPPAVGAAWDAPSDVRVAPPVRMAPPSVMARPPVLTPPAAMAPPPAVAQPAVMTPPPASAGARPDAGVLAPAAEPVGVLDLGQVVLSVVAERTGYPVEMLEHGMELEADLGIDSIKRVEILSAVQERDPRSVDADPAALAGLRTVGEIIAYLGRMAGAVAAKPAPSGRLAAPPAGPAARSSPDLQRILLAVVAERTGYPEEMLEPGMELEADLGIDSIKRVEVLAGVQERAPVALDADPAALAGLRTLGEIVTYLQGLDGGPAAGGVSPAPERLARAAVAAATGTEPAVAATERRILGVVEAPATGASVLEFVPPVATIVIAGDAGGVAPELTRRLAAVGYDARLLKSGDPAPHDAAGLILLHGLAPITDPRDALALYGQAFAAARAVAGAMQERGGFLATVTDLGGRFGLGGCDPLRAWIGGLGSLAKTAGLEWEQSRTKAIDLERAGRTTAELADAIIGELTAGGPELEVGLCADGRRWTTRLEGARVTEASDLDTEHPFIVATGGARGVTAACLIELARRVRPRLLLFGRTKLATDPTWSEGVTDEASLRRALIDHARAEGSVPSPREAETRVAAVLRSREVGATVAAFREAGAEVRYVNVDATDARAVARTIAAARGDWGPVRGIVHGAGVVADRRIAEKTDEELERVVATKLLGLDALLEATREDPLERICLFSSVAGRYGNHGQADYAMANEALNKIAQAEAVRRGGSCVVKSIAWGAWRGGMVGPALEERLQARGARLIPMEDGVRAFVAEFLEGSGSAIEVVIGGPLDGEPAGSAAPGSVGAGRTRIPGRPGDLLDRLEVSLDAYPYLADHAINGTPVVPVALALEWLARAARSRRPDLRVIGCEDLRVLRGIRLGEPGTGVMEVRVVDSMEGEDAARFHLELRGVDGAPHYSAVLELAATLPAPPGGPADPTGLAPPDFENPYSSALLFHGGAFRVIRRVEGWSSAGIAGTIVGTEAMDWPGGPWETDPALLDGGLQLALLHAHHVLGGAAVPTRIGSIRFYAGQRDGAVSRCVAHGGAVGRHRTLTDLTLIGADGSVACELRELEVHALASVSV
jgi:acyl carrier protein